MMHYERRDTSSYSRHNDYRYLDDDKTKSRPHRAPALADVSGTYEASSGTLSLCASFDVACVRIFKDDTLIMEDNGPRLTEESLRRIGDPLGSDKPEGLGLGLSIVRALLEKHAGRIAFAPGDPTGLRVTVTLPAAPAPGRVGSASGNVFRVIRAKWARRASSRSAAAGSAPF